MYEDWMKDSVVYQKIFQEGFEQGLAQAREITFMRAVEQGKLDLFLRVSRKRLGEPSVQTIEWLHTLPSSKLDELAVRLLQVETWEELLKGL